MYRLTTLFKLKYFRFKKTLSTRPYTTRCTTLKLILTKLPPFVLFSKVFKYLKNKMLYNFNTLQSSSMCSDNRMTSCATLKLIMTKLSPIWTWSTPLERQYRV